MIDWTSFLLGMGAGVAGTLIVGGLIMWRMFKDSRWMP